MPLAIAGAMFGTGRRVLQRLLDCARSAALTTSETTSSIVLYFSLISRSAGLCTLPFGWVWPTWQRARALLIVMGFFGGIGQLFMTESYRYAQASLTAPFDYTSIIWAVILGYVAFGEVPGALCSCGAGDHRRRPGCS